MGEKMAYFNYHAIAKRLIAAGKLKKYCFVERYKNISPALLLFFDDEKHPIMPIRAERFDEYIYLLKLKIPPKWDEEREVMNVNNKTHLWIQTAISGTALIIAIAALVIKLSL